MPKPLGSDPAPLGAAAYSLPECPAKGLCASVSRARILAADGFKATAFKVHSGMDSPLVCVVGTVVVVGPVESADNETTYRYLVIQDQGGDFRDFGEVRAIAELAKLVEHYVEGMFVFWETADVCRLWCVERTDGQKGVDFALLRSLA